MVERWVSNSENFWFKSCLRKAPGMSSSWSTPSLRKPTLTVRKSIETEQLVVHDAISCLGFSCLVYHSSTINPSQWKMLKDSWYRDYPIN